MLNEASVQPLNIDWFLAIKNKPFESAPTKKDIDKKVAAKKEKLQEAKESTSRANKERARRVAAKTLRSFYSAFTGVMELPVTDIVAHSGLHKTTVFRLARDLQSKGDCYRRTDRATVCGIKIKITIIVLNKKPKQLSQETLDKILSFIVNEGPISRKDLISKSGYSTSVIDKYLCDLDLDQKIKRTRVDSGCNKITIITAAKK